MTTMVPPTSWLAGELTFPIRRGVFVCWKPECHRSSMTSRCFNLTAYFVYRFGNRNFPLKLLSYITATIETVWILYRARPEVVFVLNMPPFLLMAMALYCLPTRTPFALDCHSSAYVDKKWAWFLPAYRWFSRRALFNLNHNTHDQAIVERWGGTSFLIAEIPGEIELPADTLPPLPKPNAVFVCSFAGDEPIEALFQAATLLPDVHFYVTGDHRKCHSRLLAKKPSNVNLTGLLSREDYLQLIASTMVIVSLVTRSHSMQMAATEAIVLGVPIVATESNILRTSFAGGGLFTDNTPADIASKVRTVLENREQYRSAMVVQCERRREVKRTLLRQIADFYLTNAGRGERAIAAQP